MKNTNTIEVSNKQIIEYLTGAAAHGGYSFDGVRIEPGTVVTCLKTIAKQIGVSYYRVKKCLAQLVESGRVTIARHKCFTIITICTTQPSTDPQEPMAQPDTPHDAEPEPAPPPAAESKSETIWGYAEPISIYAYSHPTKPPIHRPRQHILNDTRPSLSLSTQ